MQIAEINLVVLIMYTIYKHRSTVEYVFQISSHIPLYPKTYFMNVCVWGGGGWGCLTYFHPTLTPTTKNTYHCHETSLSCVNFNYKETCS